ncbi:MAG: DUF4013 domain-containing protein [Methanobrevibacter sp.]|nr:DUF4013 domain-containing protein [Methanobrevibacter sp.]
MEIGEIISESFKYPLNNSTEFLKVAALFVLLVIPAIFSAFMLMSNDSSLAIVSSIILMICYLIFGLIAGGYFLSVMKEGIERSGLIPEYDFAKNIVDSIKVWVLGFIFSLIPMIIIFILAFLVVGIGGSNQNALGAGMVILVIVALILEIIFCIFLTIAILRLAHYDSLSEALSVSALREDLSAIGIGNFILVYIILGLIAGVILFVGVFIMLIPIIGSIIFLMLIIPYVYLALSYGFGLMYSEIV